VLLVGLDIEVGCIAEVARSKSVGRHCVGISHIWSDFRCKIFTCWNTASLRRSIPSQDTFVDLLVLARLASAASALGMYSPRVRFSLVQGDRVARVKRKGRWHAGDTRICRQRIAR
jgi:hypothetical protein